MPKESHLQSTKSSPKAGLTRNIQDIYLSRQLQIATWPAHTVLGKTLKKKWTLGCLKKSLKKLLPLVQGRSLSISLGSLYFTPDSWRLLVSSNPNTLAMWFLLPPMGRDSTNSLIEWLNRGLTNSSGHGDQKLSSNQKRRRS